MKDLNTRNNQKLIGKRKGIKAKGGNSMRLMSNLVSFSSDVNCKSGNIYKIEKVVLITMCLYFLYYDFYY